MIKRGFSAEVLCLFFIITITIFFGKILTDVKNIISIKINQLIPQPTIVVEYNAYSYRVEETYDDLKEINVIRNKEDLKKMIDVVDDKNNDIDWLEDKLEIYDEEIFKDKTIVVLAVVNDNNITTTRVNGISKKNNDLIIGLSKNYKNKKVTGQYTWLSVLEISDTGSQILLNSY